ncbi:MAG: mannose-1-phosphate guanylyltransferase/mannose-6-phosphate isomerase [Pseudorhodobacter sp.]
MIYPIILCGGAGTRLWPLSRKAFPKQFATLINDESLFSASVKRLTGEGFHKPVVVTGSDFRFVVTEQLGKAEVQAEAILIEPDARNSAPAILAAVLAVAKRDPDAIFLVAPSDHAISDPAAFRRAASSGLPAAQAGQIVTFGITPHAPETGYGWLELGDQGQGGAIALRRFVEKPSPDKAQQMLEAGNFLWNSGLFMFSAKTILAAFERFAPQMLEAVGAAVDKMRPDLNFLRLDPEAWAAVEPNSIDYAIMEHAKNLSVIPYDAGWNDLGGWDAVAREMEADGQGVAISGPATGIDCENTLLRSESEDLELVGLGLKDLVVVAMNDAVLVADRSRLQDVKMVVDRLRAKGAAQADNFSHERRPWGQFESLAIGERFQVKRIVVNPGATLSLQSHMHRAEHWIVVSGTARVTIGDEVSLVSENQSVYVPLGTKHRMENPGKVPMMLIEVQTGTYLGEDDIIRYEDVYARGQGAKG